MIGRSNSSCTDDLIEAAISAAGSEHFMPISEETKTLQLSWGPVSEFAQAVKVGDMLYITGQITHDPESVFGRLGEMQTQMRRMYANISELMKEYGAVLENIVDEAWFVKDVRAASAARTACRRGAFHQRRRLASTIVQIDPVPFPDVLIEVRCIAKL